MPTLGEELKRRRQERGIELSEISEATRIGTRFLKSIEEGKFSTLPGGIFTRAFIRAYAKHVGMDEDEAISLYQQHLAEESDGPLGLVAEEPAQPAVRLGPIEQTNRRPGWPAILLVTALVCLVGFIVYAVAKRMNHLDEQEGPRAAATPNPSKDNRSVAGREPSPTSTVSTTKPAPTPAVSVAPTAPTASSTPPTASGGPQLGLTQSFAIKLAATSGDSWVRYQVDEGKPVTLVLKPGETHDLPPAQQQVKLNLGNRKTLSVKINNREATFPATVPNFKAQVTISRDNLQAFLQ